MNPSYSNLRKLKDYLERYQESLQPAAFEYLIASTFSYILNLPLKIKNKNIKDINLKHYVVWCGDIDKNKKILNKSPKGPDSVCFAFGFYLIVESTLREGKNQWKKEFIECFDHYDEFTKNNDVDKNDVYLILIAPRLHEDTYKVFKQKVKEGYNVIILESSFLAQIGDVCKMICTIRHLDLRHLFNNIMRKLKDSSSFTKYNSILKNLIIEWQEEVLNREKTVFFGLKSYEVVKKVGKNIVGISDILYSLHRDRRFEKYVKILDIRDIKPLIKEGLLSERLAYLITTPNEDLFCIINSADFKARGLRLIKKVESINEKS